MSSRSFCVSMTYSVVAVGAHEVVRVRGSSDSECTTHQRGIGGRSAGVDVRTEVLLGVADDTQPVGQRIEVDAECRAAEHRERIRRVAGVRAQHSSHRRCARGRVERVEARRIGDDIEAAVCGTHIDADDRFAALQTAHCDVGVERSGTRRLERQQAIVSRYAEQRRSRIRVQRQAAHALAAADGVDARRCATREIDRVQLGRASPRRA